MLPGDHHACIVLTNNGRLAGGSLVRAGCTLPGSHGARSVRTPAWAGANPYPGPPSEACHRKPSELRSAGGKGPGVALALAVLWPYAVASLDVIGLVRNDTWADSAERQGGLAGPVSQPAHRGMNNPSLRVIRRRAGIRVLSAQ